MMCFKVISKIWAVELTVSRDRVQNTAGPFYLSIQVKIIPCIETSQVTLFFNEANSAQINSINTVIIMTLRLCDDLIV